MISITECPRDAMQGIKEMIPTELKAAYLNELLKVGFDKLDFGSFVSPKAIPQMQDTAAVLERLDTGGIATRLLAIIANPRGAADASTHKAITYLGFPFSISETFQRRNTNAGIDESLERVREIQDICAKSGKKLLIYISMAFGNPYGDEWTPQLAIDWCGKLVSMGIRDLALADTTGSSNPDSIRALFSSLLPAFPEIRMAAHLHSTPAATRAKIEAAYEAGCRQFDVAIHGFGGCPMAKDDLTGNIATEELMSFCAERSIAHGLDLKQLSTCYEKSWSIFNRYH